MTLRSLVTLVFVLGTTVAGFQTNQAPAAAGDWPQWQGPDRNGLSKETGLLQKWAASGPPLAWSVSGVGGGYGSLAVKGDRIFLQGARDKQSVITVLNRADGKHLVHSNLPSLHGSPAAANGHR